MLTSDTRGEAKTLREAVSLSGRGLHSGEPVRLTVAPTRRPGWVLEVEGASCALEDARRVGVSWATTLEVDGRQARTVEHVLGALSGLWIGGARVIIEGGEAPAMDGSARPLKALIEAAGVVGLGEAQPVWRLNGAVTVTDPEAPWRRLVLTPAEGRVVQCALRFGDALPPACCEGTWDGSAGGFEAVAQARTFCDEAWLPALRAANQIRGGSLENAVVFRNGQPVNPEGLRSPDEPAQHKILDILGDLAVLGRPLLARIDAVGPGHALNGRVVDALNGGAKRRVSGSET